MKRDYNAITAIVIHNNTDFSFVNYDYSTIYVKTPAKCIKNNSKLKSVFDIESWLGYDEHGNLIYYKTLNNNNDTTEFRYYYDAQNNLVQYFMTAD